MKKYSIQKSLIEKNILHLSLSPIKPGDRLIFLPGQYATISFTGYNGRPSPARCFSIVSAPGTPLLEFAIRIQGQFTKTLSRLPAGEIISLQGPFGEFVINTRADKGIILLAGGIGITPFISMIRAASQAQFPVPLTLLFGCKNQEDIPFLPELLQLEQQNKYFKVGIFVGGGPTDKCVGARAYRGRITAEWLGRVTRGNYQNFLYYMCGPKGFMDGLSEMLIEKGVPEESIVSESFSQISRVRLNDKYSAKSFVYKATAWSLIAALFLITVTDLKQALPKLVSASQSSLEATQSITPDQSGQSSAPAISNNNSAPSTNSSVPSYNYNYSAPQYSQPYRSPRTAVS